MSSSCPLCHSPALARSLTVRGYRYGRCRGCRVWRLLDEAEASLPTPPGSGDHELRVRVFGWTVAEIERWTGVGRLLDVGSGPGHLLEAARRRGWETTGVDLDERAAALARDLFGVETTITAFRPGLVPDESYDAVALHHSLEHLPDPLEALAGARRALRPGGVLHVAVPNSRTIDRLWNRNALGDIFDPPRHRFVFSDRTLRLLVERSGFEVVVCRPQVSSLFHRFIVREVTREASQNVVARGTGPASPPQRALHVAAALAHVVAPGSAVRLYALKP